MPKTEVLTSPARSFRLRLHSKRQAQAELHPSRAGGRGETPESALEESAKGARVTVPFGGTLEVQSSFEQALEANQRALATLLADLESWLHQMLADHQKLSRSSSEFETTRQCFSAKALITKALLVWPRAKSFQIVSNRFKNCPRLTVQ